MRILLQRVSRAEVLVRPDSRDGVPYITGTIGTGFLLFVGFTQSDTEHEIAWLADKIVGLRLFPDHERRLNCTLTDCGGELLVVSQFTLYADARKGKRPSFIQAARPETALVLYNQFVVRLRELGYTVATGEFGATMEVSLVNDGPVTIWLEREAPSHDQLSRH